MEKMRFEEFTHEIVEKIREYLPVSFENASIELQTVTKNNDIKLTGLTIKSADTNLIPTIYLERYFEEYQAGASIEMILLDIADARVRNDVPEGIDIKEIMNFENVKALIIPHLVSEKWNRKCLQTMPHKVIADLAVTYHILLTDRFEETATIAIHDNLMKIWGTDVEALHELATENMSSLTPSTLESMRSVLAKITDDPDINDDEIGERLFILSNTYQVYGAAAVLDKNMMSYITDRFGEDFYIIPSSIHECLIAPSLDYTDPSELTQMVKNVNKNMLNANDILSDHVYKYTKEEGLVAA